MPVQKNVDGDEISMKNTKRELLEAYHEVLEQLHEKEKTQLHPEQTIREKKEAEVVAATAALSTRGVTEGINQLKSDIGVLLSDLVDKLTQEVERFETTQRAIEIKERELKDVYEIDRSAATLAALIEAQHQKDETFESDVAAKKETLTQEIESLRQQWEKEKAQRENETKEWEQLQAKQRQRQEEEYRYAFEREQQRARDQFEDEKARLLAEKDMLENQMNALKTQTEKTLQEREQHLLEREQEFESLQAQVATFPERLDAAAAKAVKDAAERIAVETKYRQDLLQKEFDGEKNVLTSAIQSLEKTVKEQNEQLARLSQQQESAYQKVQDVAVKAIEGASKQGSFQALQQTLRDQATKPVGESS